MKHIAQLLVIILVALAGCSSCARKAIHVDDILNNNLMQARKLVSEGASPDVAIDDGGGENSSLVFSADFGSVDMFALLLELGAKPDVKVGRRTIYRGLLAEEKFEHIRLLVAAGADIQNTAIYPDEFFVTLMEVVVAGQRGDPLLDAILERIYQRDPKLCPNFVDTFGDNLLSIMIRRGRYDAIHPLLAAGVDPSLVGKNTDVASSLELALGIGDIDSRRETVRLLVMYGVHVGYGYGRELEKIFGPFQEYVKETQPEEIYDIIFSKQIMEHKEAVSARRSCLYLSAQQGALLNSANN